MESGLCLWSPASVERAGTHNARRGLPRRVADQSPSTLARTARSRTDVARVACLTERKPFHFMMNDDDLGEDLVARRDRVEVALHEALELGPAERARRRAALLAFRDERGLAEERASERASERARERTLIMMSWRRSASWRRRS